jgi:hypothetical protein
MATKIYVSQIDTANSTGGQAPSNAIIRIGSNGPEWSNVTFFDLYGLDPAALIGYQGSLGGTGYTGSIGSVGFQGSQGATGLDGPQGAVGFTGSGGPGFTGSVGFTGSRGDTGYLGSFGYFGSVGFRGSVGSTGFTGSVGFTGSLGTTGYFGSVGFRGSSGSINFTDILDLNPKSYTGQTGGFIRVNSTGNGITFDTNTYLTATIAASLNMGGNTINAASFKAYSEVVVTDTPSMLGTFITVGDGNIRRITLNNANVPIVMQTTGLISGKLYSVTFAIKQDSTGNRTVDWSNQTVYWPTSEGIYAPTGPTLSTTAGYTDFVTLSTFDGGGTWYGVLAAKGFATPV